jgi:hypothetical protein
MPGRRVGLAVGFCLLEALLACVPDSVAPGDYGADPDAAVGHDVAAAPGDVPSRGDDPASDDAAAASGGVEAGAPAGPCDLTGAWIATNREVTTGLGAVEAAHNWFYLEIAQTGSAFTVTHGLLCGANVRGVSAVSANVDYPKTWPALIVHDVQTGHKGTSAPASSSQCRVDFDQFYVVMGATVPFYEDPSQPLPTLSQQASGGAPGWEDWDMDGNPSFTMNVTGLATGQIYEVNRRHCHWSGTIAASAPAFQLADDWDTEQSLLGYSGSSLLTEATSGAKDSDPSEHFVGFARLTAAQAAGSDTTVCATVRSLAPTLTPTANN